MVGNQVYLRGHRAGRIDQWHRDLKLVCDHEAMRLVQYIKLVEQNDHSVHRQYAIERHMEAGGIRTMLWYQQENGIVSAKNLIQPGCPGYSGKSRELPR